MFTVRRVDITNAIIRAAIKTMHAECFPKDDSITPTHGDWWVAFWGKKDAGYIGLIKATRATNAAYLCSVGVLPQFRGNGLQTRMTRSALQALRGQYESVVTDCRAYNAPSANSLIRCGFRVYVPDSPWGFSDAVYWRREL